MLEPWKQKSCLNGEEDDIVIHNSKISTSFYRKIFGSLERCHHKTLQLQLLVTTPGCQHSTPEMLTPTGQKQLDKNNFKLLIKYLVAGEQRERRQSCFFCTVCKQAGRKLVLPAFHPQHNHPRCPWEEHCFPSQMGVEKSPQKQGCAEPLLGKSFWRERSLPLNRLYL